MKYKLQNTEGLTAQQILDWINRGATFRIFTYQVALVAITFSRPSPAILIRNDGDLIAARKRYNLKTLLYGLWFFPLGPINVYRRIKNNNNEGIDITGDILLNLPYYDKEQQTVDIKIAYTLFDHLPKDDFHELRGAIENFCLKNISIKSVYTGRYINIDGEPPYFIGCDTNMEMNKLKEALKPLIDKKFQKFAHFEIFTKRQDEELFEKIKRQGQKIIEKKL